MNIVDFVSAALSDRDAGAIQSLIDRGVVNINQSIFRHSLLVEAVLCQSSAAVVEVLLNAGACIDDVDARKRTVCHIAVEDCSEEVLAVLLKHRPNLALLDERDKTPFDLACSYLKHFRVVAMLIAAGAPLANANHDQLAPFVKCFAPVITALLDRGFDVRDLDDRGNGFFLLRGAIRVGNPATLRMLLNECGCCMNPFAPNSPAKSCAHSAVEYHNAGTLSVLVEAGAHIEDRNVDGDTPLLAACKSNDYECVTMLLACGANVHARGSDGDTVFHLALCWEDEPESLVMSVVHSLLACDASLDSRNDDGETARERLSKRGFCVDANQIEAERRRIAKMRIDFVRTRALQVCIGLQSLHIDALQMCEIVRVACGPLASMVPFHHWWAIATTVKHFHH